MANITHLYKVETFRDLYPLNVDVDAKILKNVLYSAQQVKIQGLLGTDLYKKILTLVDSGDITLAGNVAYKTLLDDHVLNVLGYHGYSDAVLHISQEMTDKGAQTKSSEFSQPVVDFRSLRKEAVNKAEFMADIMVKFLCKNSADYPEYYNYDEGIRANKKPYFSSIQFDDYGGDDCGLNNA